MPFTRKRNFRRKRPFRKKKYIPKKSKFGVTKSLNYNGYHTFKERCAGTVDFSTADDGSAYAVNSVTFNPSATPKTSWRFALNDMADFGSYQRLFQSAMLTGVKIKIFPNHNTSNTTMDGTISQTGATLQSQSLPTLLWKNDTNSVTQPSSFQNLMKRDPHNRYFTKPVTIYIKNPAVFSLQNIDPSGPTNVGNMVRQPKTRQWLNIDGNVNAAGGTVQHAGLSMGLMNATANSIIPYQFIATYYFQCKHVN